MNEQDLAQIQRRQRIAEMLMAQGQEPINANRMAGGYVVPVQPLEAVSKIAQQLTGAYLGKKASDRYASLAQQDRDALANLDLGSPDAEKTLIGQGRIAEALALRKSNMSQTRPNYYQPTNQLIQDPETGQFHLRRYGSDPNVEPITDTAPIPQTMRWLDKGNQFEPVPTKGTFWPQSIPNQSQQPTRQKPNGSKITYDDVVSWLPSQMMVESGGDPNAVSYKGAQGLAQIMPETAKNPGYGMAPIDLENSTPEQQALWAAEYQAKIAQAHPNWTREQVISSYNMGPGNTEKGRINNDYVNKVIGGIRKNPTPAQVMQNDPVLQSRIAGAEEAAKQAAKVEAEQNLAPIKADAEKQKVLAKEQASFMASFPERMNALEKTKTIIDNAILALDVQKDKKGNVTGYGLETGGKAPALQQWYYQDVMNDPARRALDMAAAKEQLQGAIEYLKGQGQVTEGERAIVALLSGIDPYKYDSATNYKYLKQAQDLLVKQLDALKRRASGDFSTSGYELKREAPKQENKVETKRKMTEAEIEELRQLEAEFGGM